MNTKSQSLLAMTAHLRRQRVDLFDRLAEADSRLKQRVSSLVQVQQNMTFTHGAVTIQTTYCNGHVLQGLWSASEDSVFPDHWHEESFEVLGLLEGEVRVVCFDPSTEQVAARAGEIIHIPPGVVHRAHLKAGSRGWFTCVPPDLSLIPVSAGNACALASTGLCGNSGSCLLGLFKNTGVGEGGS